ncbi:MAG: hypothetical protein ACI4XP_11555 [Acutalibacteraceae bacterium]
MFKSSVAGQRWAMAKVIMAICALAFAAYMIYCGVNYIKLNTNQGIGREITPSDYATLSVGEQVNGTIDSVVCEYQTSDDVAGNNLTYYLVKSDDKIITFKTELGSTCDNKMRSILNGSGETLHYKGYVNTLSSNDRKSLGLYALTNNILLENGMKGDFNDHIIPLEISVTEYSDRSNTNAILGAFVMAALMLFLAFMLLKKVVVDCIYSFKLSKGKIQPEVKLTPDEPLENKKMYDGGASDEGFFYVGYEEQENDENNS